ncbi:hypothetical protein [Jannaschia sp. R86511]|uniref:hypothetical protein n=1 Tax=Jannaschia sp. R86511 TaxID=3093853 RepID=UPI0036D40995
MTVSVTVPVTRLGRPRTDRRAPGPDGLTRSVSGLLPRVVVVLAAGLGLAAQTVGGGLPPGALLVLVAALLTAWRPSMPTVVPALLGLAVLAVVGGGGPDLRDAVTVLAVHALHVAAGLAAVVPASARLELAALRPTVRRFLLVQALSQATVAVALAVSLAR